MPQHSIPEGTKLALLLAAGELFAEKGPDAVGIRAIADKAKANSSLINYYFGTKDNLYTSVLIHVISRGNEGHTALLLECRTKDMDPHQAAEMIRRIVKERFASYYSPDRPAWHMPLFMRAISDPTPSLRAVAEQLFRPDHEALKALLLRAKPSLTDREAQILAFSLIAQIAFYMLARVPILMILGREEYDPAFLADAAEEVSNVILAGLGLAQPKVGVSDHEWVR